MIDLACPHCGAGHQLDDSAAGERLSCHACGKKFRVPGVRKGGASSSSKPVAADPQVPEPYEFGDLPESEDGAAFYSNEGGQGSGGGRVGEVDHLANELGEEEWQGALPEDGDAEEPVESDLISPLLNVDILGVPSSDEPKAGVGAESGGLSDHPSDLEPLPIDPLMVDGDEASERGLEGAGERGGEIEDLLAPLRIDDLLDSDDESAGGEPGDEVRVKCRVCDGVTWVKPSKVGQQIVCSDCGTLCEVPKPRAGDIKRQTSKPKSTSGREKEADKVDGWRLSEPVERPKTFQFDENLGGLPGVHVPAVRTWGQPKDEPEEKSKGAEAGDDKRGGDKGGEAADESKSVESSQEPNDDGVETPIGYEAFDWKEPPRFAFGEWMKDAGKLFLNPSIYGGIAAMTFVIAVLGATIRGVMFQFMDSSTLSPLFQALARIAGLFCWAGTPVVAILLSLVASVLGMTLMNDSASNSKTLGNWPEFNFMEYLWSLWPMAACIYMAAIPGVLGAQAMTCIGLGTSMYLVLPVLSVAVFFPPLMTSVFYEQSVARCLSPVIFKTLDRFRSTWIAFYLLTLGLLLLVVVPSFLWLAFVPFPLNLLAAPILGTCWLVYIRWLGVLMRRIAWQLQEADGKSEE